MMKLKSPRSMGALLLGLYLITTGCGEKKEESGAFSPPVSMAPSSPPEKSEPDACSRRAAGRSSALQTPRNSKTREVNASHAGNFRFVESQKERR